MKCSGNGKAALCNVWTALVVTHNWSQASDLELIWEFFENIWQTDASQKERLADLCERIHTRHIDLSELKQTNLKLKQ